VKGVPPDYYRRLDEAERRHWYHRGMERLSAALLGDRLSGALLDAGCGTGGFLRFARSLGSFDRLCGVDVSAEAIELAREELPDAELHVGPLTAVPFEDASFDLVTLNDVLQHIEEREVEASLRELRRVLKPAGALLLRTNGGRTGSRPRTDWRLYTRAELVAELKRGGFNVERVTYANLAVSTLRAARGLTPKAPSETTSGIPPASGRLAAAIGPRLLELEARYLLRPGRSLPYGHTLLAVATPA
jgi:ubiquinone/menaquinone biosynthesis C-methylase UbiE